MTLVADDAAPSSSNAPSQMRKERLRALGKKAQSILITHFLPISFLIATIIALAYPEPGVAVASVTIADDIHVIAAINMIIVFFISGLVLKTQDLKQAWEQKLGFSFGVVTILGITPCLGFALREIPLTPPEYAQGLTLFAAVPTTLGVGMSLVGSCKGNVGLSMLLTVVTNMLGCLTTPLWLKALFPRSSDAEGLGEVSVDVLTLFIRLLITILVPAVIGKLMRDCLPPVRQFADRRKTWLSLFSTFNLAFIVWQTLSGAQSIIFSTPFVETLYAILLAIAQHLIYLALNTVAVLYVFRMALPEAIATALMGSQKSAPVAVTVINNLNASLEQRGLLAVPCICGQIFQIFIGSSFVPYLTKCVDKYNAAQAKIVKNESRVGVNGVIGDLESSVGETDLTTTDGVEEKDKRNEELVGNDDVIR